MVHLSEYQCMRDSSLIESSRRRSSDAFRHSNQIDTSQITNDRFVL